MADEVVRYEFEGDSSRLQQATQSAIDSLTLYEDTVKNIQSTINNLSSSINDMVDWMRLLSNEMKNMVSMSSTASDSFKDIRNASTQYAEAVRSATTAQQANAKAAGEVDKAQQGNNNTAIKSKSVFTSFASSINKVSGYLDKLKSSTKETSAAFDTLSGIAETATVAVKTLMGIDLASIFNKSAINAMDYIENLNLFNVAMGDSVSQGKKFVSQIQEVYGLDPSNIMTYVGNFNQLASAIEMPAKTANTLATGMTKMSTDIASVFNMDVVDVINNMKSGMIGMTRAVTKYGMDIRTSTLQQTALSLGITDNVRNMSEANREGLRYITMVRQASNLSGDWAKTIESPSNQLRILKEQLSQLARAIGNLFLPSIAKVLPYINGFVMALREAITAVAEFFGFTQIDFGGTTSTIDKSTNAITDMGTEADKTAKKLQSLKAPFDELNVIQEPSSSTKDASPDANASSEMMDPAIAKAIDALNVPLENVRMKANKVRDALLEVFNLKGDTFQNVLTKIKAALKGIWDVLTTLAGKFTAALTYNGNGQQILNTFKGILADIYNWFMRIIQDTKDWASKLNLEPIVSAFNGLLQAIRKLAKVIGDQLEQVYKNVLLPFGKWTIEKALPDMIKALTNALNWFSDHPDIVAIITGVAIAIGLIVGAVKTAISVVTTISNIMNVLQGVFTAITVITGASLGTILGVVAAIAAVIAIITVVMTHLDDIKAWIKEMKTKISSFIDGIKDKFTSFKDSIKEAFEPVISFFSSIIDKCKEIVTVVIGNIKTVIDKFVEIKNKIQEIFQALSKAFKIYVVDNLVDWWNNHIIGPITSFYNTYLKPVVDTIKEKVIEPIKEGFSNVIEDISSYFTKLKEDIVTGCRAVLKFMLKIATKVAKGIANIFIGNINNIIGFFEFLINGIVAAVNLLVDVANKVPGVNISKISDISLTKISYLATGGVATGPTQAVLGEGKYDEAVIPLGNSPQLNEMLDKFAEKVNQQPINVTVKIGDKDWDAFTYKSAQRGQYLVGDPIIGGNI